MVLIFYLESHSPWMEKEFWLVLLLYLVDSILSYFIHGTSDQPAWQKRVKATFLDGKFSFFSDLENGRFCLEKRCNLCIFVERFPCKKISGEIKIFQMYYTNTRGTTIKIFFRYLHSVKS